MDHLQTEARNQASANLDELSPRDLARLMNAEDGRVIAAVTAQLDAIARATEIIADRLAGGGRLIYVGAGTSGRLGVLDAAECPPTFNSPPGQVVGLIAGGPEALTRSIEGAEDHPEAGRRDLETLGLTSRDVVVTIATSGRTPYVLGAAAYSRAQGVFTVGISCNPDSDLFAVVDLPIPLLVGPEVLSGSTRLKAGTATKLVLNMLSTGAMVRLGKTYGNLMVDLRATNSKLRARTNRIIRAVAGLSIDEADNLLRQCGGELKTALVVKMAGVTPEEARARLIAAGGRVRDAVQGRHTIAESKITTESQGPLKIEEPKPLGVLSDSVVLSEFGTAKPTLTPGDLLLGIDGGGSSTVAFLAVRSEPGDSPWTVLGRGEAGSSNRQAVGTEAAVDALDKAVKLAFTEARLLRTCVAAACLGLAGADRPEDRSVILEWARHVRLAQSVEVTNDAALLLAAGTPKGWGLALVAGTGSIAYGRRSDGRTARAGGWGYLLGDEGSAYAIALAGLQAVARAADGCGGETSLTECLLKRLGINRPEQLIPALYQSKWDKAALARLAIHVFDCAENDVVATQIITQAAEELARTAAAVARKLAWSEGSFPLALAGGLLMGNEPYRQSVLSSLQSLGLRPEPIAMVPEPAQGALKIAAGLVAAKA
jgi:N-acetylmuramic acid 6-phosphate etherase